MTQMVEIRRLHPDATLPTRGSPGAAALDLYAVEDVFIESGQCVPVHTHIAVNMTKVPNLCAIVIPRSGLGAKKGLILGNTAGLIDNDYQGEILCYMWLAPRKDGPEALVIKKGERFAQLVFFNFAAPPLGLMDEFSSETTRGDKGFGSTGG